MLTYSVVDIGFCGVLVSRFTYSVVYIGFCDVLVSRLAHSVINIGCCGGKKKSLGQHSLSLTDVSFQKHNNILIRAAKIGSNPHNGNN
jgi:hypothetical protein